MDCYSRYMQDAALFFFTVLASTTGFFTLAVLIYAYLFFTGRRIRGTYFFVSALGLAGTVALLKELFRVARPDTLSIEVTGYAFPSGHAAGSAFLFFSLALLSRGRSTPLRYTTYAVCAFLTLMISLSRVYYGAHTWLQVAAGIVLGLLWASAWYLADRRTTTPLRRTQ